MGTFNGFPAGKVRTTPLPSQFFTELLPAIDDLAELKVTLYAFWRLHHKEGDPRYLRRADFAGDDLFMRGLGADGEHALDEALGRTIARGTLLLVSIESAQGVEALYFLNSARGRAAVAALERGRWRPSGLEEAPVELAAERPNIFTLYEQNIGVLTPLIVDQLKAAEAEYPAAWVEEAIRAAVANNVRRWRYIEAILERWRAEGKDRGTARGDSEADLRRYIEGKYKDIIQH